MKKSRRAIVSLIIVLVLMLTISVTAYAVYTSYNYGKNWKTIAYSSSGLNKSIQVTCYNTTGHTNDVRMLDSNGNTVWYEEGAITYSGVRTFWCGSDVCTVQIRNKGIIGNLTSETCIVIY